MLNNADKAIQYLKESQELVENKSDILMSVETLVNSQVL
jgi:hypothetical protein